MAGSSSKGASKMRIAGLRTRQSKQRRRGTVMDLTERDAMCFDAVQNGAKPRGISKRRRKK